MSAALCEQSRADFREIISSLSFIHNTLSPTPAGESGDGVLQFPLSVRASVLGVHMCEREASGPDPSLTRLKKAKKAEELAV